MQVQICLVGVPDNKENLRVEETSNILFVIEAFSFNKRIFNLETINFR